jgi:uncharacterized iron-regulated membrane protein
VRIDGIRLQLEQHRRVDDCCGSSSYWLVEAMKTDRSAKSRSRRIIFQIHGYAGLLVGLMLTVVSLSGSAVVFYNEIEQATNSGVMRVSPQSNRRISLQEVLSIAKESHPHYKVVSIEVPSTSESVYRVVTRSSDYTQVHVFINPYTGQITGLNQLDHSWLWWLLNIHIDLYAGSTGSVLNGVGAGLLLLMCFTGIIIWWPGRMNLRRGFTIKSGVGWKRLNYDLHRVAGVISMALLACIALTGLYFVFPDGFRRAIERMTMSPPRPSPPSSTSQEISKVVSLDELAQRAQTAVPEGELLSITLPSGQTSPIIFRKKAPDEVSKFGRSRVFFDQYSGELLRVEDARQASLATRILWLMAVLHIGTVAGFWTQVLLVFLGLVPPMLFFSGFLMWWHRVVARRWRRRPVTNSASRGRISNRMSVSDCTMHQG